MAGTFKGLFEGFKLYVQHQLNIRKNILLNGRTSDRPENFYTYTTEKKCFIRLCSGVDVEENNTLLTDTDDVILNDGETRFKLTGVGLARNYILEGGVLDPRIEEFEFTPNMPETENIKEKQQFLLDQGYNLGKTGINKDGVDGDWGNKSISASAAHEQKMKDERANEVWKQKNIRSGFGIGGAYGDPRIRAGSDSDFGMVAMPGIIDAEIRTKSSNGSLREAKINFRAHNKRQLEVLETLYMRPGYTMLVEWGWSPYINNERKIAYFPEVLDEWFDPQSTDDFLSALIVKRKIESGGNYDGCM